MIIKNSNTGNWRKAALCGTAGSIVYILHVVIGGFLWEGYDHMSMVVSTLTAIGFKYTFLLSALTIASGTLLLIFSIGAYRIFMAVTNSKLIITGTKLMTASLSLVVVEYIFIPYDNTVPFENIKNLPHEAATFFVVSGLILACFLIGLGLKTTLISKRFGAYSIICSAIVAFFGACTPLLILIDAPIAGLIERIGMITLYSWFFAASLYIAKIKIAA